MGNVKNYMDNSFLDWFQLLSLCAVDEVMPDRRIVFENWADYCYDDNCVGKCFVWSI